MVIVWRQRLITFPKIETFLLGIPILQLGDIHSFTPIVLILDMDIRVRITHMCAEFEKNRIRIAYFRKMTLT